MRTDDLDQVEKALLTCPPVLLRIVRMPEAEGTVLDVSVLRTCLGLGVNPGAVLGQLTVGGIRRSFEEPDRDCDRIRLTHHVQTGQPVGQHLRPVRVLKLLAEAVPGVALERGPPCGLDPVPEAHVYGAQA